MTQADAKPTFFFFSHKGRPVWCEPYPHQSIPLEYWYRLDCYNCGILFDVRELPGFSEFPGRPPRDSWDAIITWFAARHQHYAEIIAQAIDAGNLPGAGERA